MKAPDKIYLFVFASPLLHRDVLENHWAKEPSPLVKENITYIRKDALLEWAKKKQYDSMTIVADNFWQEVIDKLNSL